MTNGKMIMVVGAVLGLGCGGGDVCKRAQSSLAGLATKTANCTQFANSFLAWTDVQTAACSSSLKNCTATDTRNITATLDCWDKLATCVAGSEAAFGNALAACPAAAPTPNCLCWAAGTPCTQSASDQACCGTCGTGNTCG